VAFSNEDPGVGAERVRVESGAQVVANQLDCVVGSINCKGYVSGVLRHGDMITVQIVFAVTDVGQLQIVQELEDFVHVDILGLFQDRDVE